MKSDTATSSGYTRPMVLVGLVSASLFINYIDRGNLATGAKQISADLNLSATAYGTLLAAFYFSYTLLQLPMGMLADRWGCKRVLGLGALIWSISTLLTGFATSFPQLVALRFLLGLGECVAFTTASKLIAVNVPRDKVSLANGIIGFGYMVGPAVGTLLGGMLMVQWGWRPVFVAFGALSLLWLLPWSRVRLRPEPVTTGDGATIQPVPLSQILRQRALWGASIGHFAGNWNWYFILGYLPLYLEKARGFDKVTMAEMASAAYLVNALTALLGGWAIGRLMASGRSATIVCKVPLACAQVVGLVSMLLMPVLPITGCIACLFAYEIFLGLSSAQYFMIPQIMGGPAAVARWVGIQNMMGNFPGIIGLFFAGVLIDASDGSYFNAFLVAGLINVLGFIGWVFILPRIEPVDWAKA
ncbi:MFS transporter [Novosphingobium sp.]|uniref:MFS transporter n=1 Tax=Novosphingobium sp. TaxID=1874826 RepID=UPI00333EEB8A